MLALVDKYLRGRPEDAPEQREFSGNAHLIAEDNIAQRRYVRELLEREFPSHTPVLEAGDGETTVELALEHMPELCVLDIQMPKLSGVKAARAIWRIRHLSVVRCPWFS